MPDLDAAIRARLAEFTNDHLLVDERGSNPGPGHGEMKAALLAVLDLHHREPALGGCARCDTMWPCRHVRTIAEKLGVEA